jgi:acyl-homoserine lactone synthase
MMILIHGSDVARHQTLMEEAFRLRHRVFVEELGWSDLRSAERLEQDQFDHEEAVHHLCMHQGRVVGYQRMLPTTRPHLLSDVFPELCEEAIPRGPGIYEWTRNCVAREWRDSATGVSRFSFELTLAVVEWGLGVGVDTVTVEYDPLFLLRALQMQFLVRPLGYQRIIAGRPTVAVSMRFDMSTLATVRRAYGSADSVFSSPIGKQQAPSAQPAAISIERRLQ